MSSPLSSKTLLCLNPRGAKFFECIQKGSNRTKWVSGPPPRTTMDVCVARNFFACFSEREKVAPQKVNKPADHPQ